MCLAVQIQDLSDTSHHILPPAHLSYPHSSLFKNSYNDILKTPFTITSLTLYQVKNSMTSEQKKVALFLRSIDRGCKQLSNLKNVNLTHTDQIFWYSVCQLIQMREKHMTFVLGDWIISLHFVAKDKISFFFLAEQYSKVQICHRQSYRDKRKQREKERKEFFHLLDLLIPFPNGHNGQVETRNLETNWVSF